MYLQLTTKDRRRFEAKVYRIPGGCHIWTGLLDRRGYGEFKVKCDDGEWRSMKAHRAAWLLSGREFDPDRPCVLHDCPGGDWPSCVNVGHLWSGTIADNNLDMARKWRGTTGALPYGVGRVHQSKKFKAEVSVGGQQTYLGVYDTPGEAHAVAVAAKDRLVSEALAKRGEGG